MKVSEVVQGHKGSYLLYNQLNGQTRNFLALNERNKSVVVKSPKSACEHFGESTEYCANCVQRETTVLTYIQDINGVTRLIDESSPTGQSDYFIVLKFIHGNDLADVIQNKITQKRAIRYTNQLCKTIKELHSRGIIHRDIKPENIRIHKGRVHLLDFGLAYHKSVKSLEQKIKPGTEPYTSPEQWRGDIDVRTDIFSIGAVFYQMLGGIMSQKYDTKIGRNVFFYDKKSISPKLLEESGDLFYIVERATAWEKEERFHDVNELHEEIKKAQKLKYLISVKN